MKKIFIVLLLLSLACDPDSTENTNSSSNTGKSEQLAFEQGDFSGETKSFENKIIIRFLQDKKVLTRLEFIDLLAQKNQQGIDFRKLVNKTLANINLSTNGFQLKAPIIINNVAQENFYFVAVPATFPSKVDETFYPYFIHCKDAAISLKITPQYENHFITLYGKDLMKVKLTENKFLSDGTTAFLGGSSTKPESKKIMVSPCPFNDAEENESVIHLFAYAKKLEELKLKERIQSFWYTVGKMATKLFDGDHLKDSNGNITHEHGLFLNTHGHGVSYLHFRVELSSSYYGSVEFLTTEQKSIDYYNRVFK